MVVRFAVRWVMRVEFPASGQSSIGYLFPGSLCVVAGAWFCMAFLSCEYG